MSLRSVQTTISSNKSSTNNSIIKININPVSLPLINWLYNELKSNEKNNDFVYNFKLKALKMNRRKTSKIYSIIKKSEDKNKYLNCNPKA
jgi:hypothetical protein